MTKVMIDQLSPAKKLELYEHVMRYRPRDWFTLRAKAKGTQPPEVARRTGVHRSTVVYWWDGGGGPGSARGKQKNGLCRNQRHPLDGDNLLVHKSGRRECKACARERGRKTTLGIRAERDAIKAERDAAIAQGYRDRYEYHPVHNPDLALANLECLWVPAVDVGRLMLRSYPADEIRQLFSERRGDTVVRSILAGNPKRKWVRLDVADYILCQLGLLPCMLDTDPVYSGGKAPC